MDPEWQSSRNPVTIYCPFEWHIGRGGYGCVEMSTKFYRSKVVVGQIEIPVILNSIRPGTFIGFLMLSQQQFLYLAYGLNLDIGFAIGKQGIAEYKEIALQKKVSRGRKLDKDDILLSKTSELKYYWPACNKSKWTKLTYTCVGLLVILFATIDWVMKIRIDNVYEKSQKYEYVDEFEYLTVFESWFAVIWLLAFLHGVSRIFCKYEAQYKCWAIRSCIPQNYL